MNRLPGEQAEHQCSDRPDIGSLVDEIPASPGLFRRHVRGSAQEAVGDRILRRSSDRQRSGPEVEHFDGTGGRSKHVRWFQIAMQDPACVGNFQHREYGYCAVHYVKLREPAGSFTDSIERLSVEKLHDHERQATGAHAGFVKLRETRMLNRPQNECLPLKTLHAHRIARQVMPEKLDSGDSSVRMDGARQAVERRDDGRLRDRQENGRTCYPNGIRSPSRGSQGAPAAFPESSLGGVTCPSQYPRRCPLHSAEPRRG